MTSLSGDDSLSEFRKQVYLKTQEIPKGKAATYGAISEAISGNKNSCRAVGNALRHNPFAPQVPCHRVVASSGLLNGFNGSTEKGGTELCKKAELLIREGVRIVQTSRGQAVHSDDLLAAL
jgi:methylated-DNA-[protein]-cysteine S-methyltransferase